MNDNNIFGDLIDGSILDGFLEDLTDLFPVIDSEGGTDPDNIDGDRLNIDNPSDTEDTIIEYTDLLDGTVTGGSDDGTTFQNVKSAFIKTGSGNDNINLSATVEGNDVVSGAGNDTIVGGSGNDDINSGAGNDVINSGAGNDTIVGGAGNDRVNSGSGDDKIGIGTGADTVDGGTGNDRLYLDNSGIESRPTDTANTIINYTTLSNGAITRGSNNGTTFKNIESVNFSTGSGNDKIDVSATTGSNLIESNAGNDTIVGGSGNDNINSGAGNDSVTSGAGNDTVNAGAGNDIVNTGAGNDSVNGGAGNDSVNGGAGNDRIDGQDGNDTLNGGAGNDIMIGGAGNDIYVVDSVGDVVIEASTSAVTTQIDAHSNITTQGVDTLSSFTTTTTAPPGIDTVQSSITYTLGANIENLTLTGTGNINGTGNGLNNTITGNAGKNILTGGAGNDNLIGGAGNDTLTGGAGNDTLNGGTGNDSMTGGAGNDTYVVDSSGDLVNEAVNGGTTDTVSSSLANYTLVVNVENLNLTGAANGNGNGLNNIINGGTGSNIINGGAGNDIINGGAGSDTIKGDAGNDIINGGAGSDTLTGGAGRDTFVFSGNPLLSLLNAIGIDRITDLTLSGANQDTIQLSEAYFTELSDGGIFSVVTTNAAAATSIGEIVYNRTNGQLFYNADGSDAGFGVNGGQFAQLNTGLALTAGSFTVGA